MPEFGWVSTPTGVYRNHAISGMLRKQAVSDTRFMRHVTPEPDYGPGMGESVTMTRVRQLTVPTTPYLNEFEKIPEDTFTMTTVSATVRELGRAIAVTKFGQVLSKFSLTNTAEDLLREQLKQY